MNNRHVRSLDEWLTLVTECRQSGLSDVAWCEQNGIPSSSFYNAVTRLRKNACDVPAAAGKATTLDLTTSSHQDVVRIDIQPEDSPADLGRLDKPSMYLDNSHTIEIETEGISIRINNSVHPDLLKNILITLRSSAC